MHFAIVSYTFPPSQEIGGRRWAKFSQHLSRLGHKVTIICADKAGAPPGWYEKEYPGLEVILLPKRYPDWLSGYTKSILEKLYYFIFVRILSPLTKQNLFDTGFAWKKTMLRALEDLHTKNKIDVLVATGAPFSLLYYGSAFKNRHKEIFYVTDLRDPWTWGSYYGIPALSRIKKKYQELSEYSSVKSSDMVCYPTDNMGNFLKQKYPEFSPKFYLLPHAYEADKFPKTAVHEKKAGFIYGGTLYKGIEDYLKRIADVLKSNPNSGFKWDIYTGTHYPLLDDPAFAHGCILKHPLVPEERLFLEIKKSAAYLALFPETDKDLISTKFFEIIYAGTPILYIGEEGDVGRFVRENRVGVHILPANIEKELPKYLNGNVPFEPGYFDVSQYSFHTVTENFLKALANRKTG